MRLSLRLFAQPSTITKGSGLTPLPAALLPPLQLYRRILRTHRKHLPAHLRMLGDEYVKSEFRLHREVENPLHIVGFLTEWQLYAQKLEGDTWRGEKIDQDILERLSDQQIGQLYELLQAVKNQGQDEEEGESEKK
ncbi:acetate non-utilizing protein 9 [Ascosphaera atra]|nr:acetate non-utilizing protein 9 [Ascosphaera atra]